MRMQRRTWIALLAALAITLLLVPACSRDAEPDAAGPGAWPPASAEPTVPADPQARPAAANEGLPIVDLADAATAGDDADRVALLSAAHAATGIGEDFYVWQLLVQGTSAVGDLQGSVSGERKLVAFERDGSAWRVAYQVRFLDASRAALLARAPSVTEGLAGRVDFVVPVDVDPFFTGIAEGLVAQGREAGVSAMAVYAPTRLPEGFTLTEAVDHDFYSAVANYASGTKRLAYVIIIASDYGEDPPDFVYDSLRFGDIPAAMAGTYHNGGLSEGIGRGPHLATRLAGEHYLVAEGVSPGIVAAVAESMVRVR